MGLQGALLGLVVTSTGVVFEIFLRVSGRVHKSIVWSLYPCKIMVFLYTNSHLLSLKVTLHPALHMILMPIKNAIVTPGTICPVNIVGRPDMVMSQMWVGTTLLPPGKVMVIGWSTICKFLWGVPFIMKIEANPVPAMACIAAIVIAFAHSKHCNSVEQFDAITVALLSSIDSSAAKGSKRLFSMGYNEVY